MTFLFRLFLLSIPLSAAGMQHPLRTSIGAIPETHEEYMVTISPLYHHAKRLIGKEVPLRIREQYRTEIWNSAHTFIHGELVMYFSLGSSYEEHPHVRYAAVYGEKHIVDENNNTIYMLIMGTDATGKLIIEPHPAPLIGKIPTALKISGFPT